MRGFLHAAAFAIVALAAPAAAQGTPALVQTVSGTRLDVSATGEVTRVPDLAIISAGVVTRSATATAALEENAARMERVRSALNRAGIAAKDVQTSQVSLNPEYRYADKQAPQLVGYTASNQLSVKFRDIRATGRILDALVAEGANQINGPTLTIYKPEAALDEARGRAIAAGRARAELYARALGMRVARLISVSEGGGYSVPPPVMLMRRAESSGAAADTSIEPGTQELQVTLAMSFELQ